MPKMKTHSGAKKRFRISKGSLKKGGKLMRERTNLRHLLESKSSRRTRRLQGITEVSENDTKTIRKMLGI